jgi:preprotein translocase subunit SecA
MDYLREGIGLRALAQRDPLVEYRNEGFRMFQEMMDSIQADFVRYLYHLEIVREEQPQQEAVAGRGLAYSGGGDSSLAQNFAAAGAAAASAAPAGVTDSSAEAYEAAQQATRTVVAPRSVSKVGRNDPCPCGSGKKYKRCCGA